MSVVYKVCTKEEWNQALINGFYAGSEIDAKDGFIHLSTKNQLNETLTKHFQGKKNLIIISFSLEKIQDCLKWEFSRNGDLFPHYYGHLKTKFAENIFNLFLNTDGIHEFPKSFFS
tara:strand:- start:313 stop:660 length:348 start_codon:yes stop_codon:yes gene_type:complete